MTRRNRGEVNTPAGTTKKWTALLLDAVFTGRLGPVVNERLEELLRWLAGAKTPDVMAITVEVENRDADPEEARQLALALLDRLLFDEGNDDPYLVLALSPGVELKAVQARYKRLISIYHPDRNKGDPEWLNDRADRLNRAYAGLRKRLNGPAGRRPGWHRGSTVVGGGSSPGARTNTLRPDPVKAYPGRPSGVRQHLGSAPRFQYRFFFGLILVSLGLLAYIYFVNAPLKPRDTLLAARPPAGEKFSPSKNTENPTMQDMASPGRVPEDGRSGGMGIPEQGPDTMPGDDQVESSNTEESISPESDRTVVADLDSVHKEAPSLTVAAKTHVGEKNAQSLIVKGGVGETNRPVQEPPNKAQVAQKAAVLAKLEDAHVGSDTFEELAAQEEGRLLTPGAKRGEEPILKPVPRASLEKPASPARPARVVPSVESKKKTKKTYRKQLDRKFAKEVNAVLNRFVEAVRQGNVRLLESLLLKDNASLRNWRPLLSKYSRRFDDTVARYYRLRINSKKLVERNQVRAAAYQTSRFVYLNGRIRESEGEAVFELVRSPGGVYIGNIVELQETVKVGSVLQPVQSLLKRYSDAYRDGNIDAFVGLFTEDIVENEYRGKYQIRRTYSALFKNTRSRDVSFNVNQITALDGTYFLIEGTFSAALKENFKHYTMKDVPIRMWVQEGATGYRIAKMQY